MLLELIRERKISDALQFAQDVLAEKGAEDPALLEDFERAMALLAFDKPEDSPYGDLLELSRREEVPPVQWQEASHDMFYKTKLDQDININNMSRNQIILPVCRNLFPEQLHVIHLRMILPSSR